MSRKEQTKAWPKADGRESYLWKHKLHADKHDCVHRSRSFTLERSAQAQLCLTAQNSGLLRQPDPEGSQGAVWPQLSTDTVLRRGSFRGDGRVREGRRRQHRCPVHRV